MSKSAVNTATNVGDNDVSYFEQQREVLIHDIGLSLENVLQNINKLNRNLEGIIAVGNEFSSVEALWSHFENVMTKDSAKENGTTEGQERHEEGHEDHKEAGSAQRR